LIEFAKHDDYDGLETVYLSKDKLMKKFIEIDLYTSDGIKAACELQKLAKRIDKHPRF
jgi:hypothetical protein